MLEAESEGLSALRDANAVRVPTPVACGVAGDVAFLALEWLDFGHGGRDAALGRALAQLHRTTGPRFGWHRDNTIGTTPQDNTWSDDWTTFYRDRRILPQLALAARNGHRGAFERDGERLLAAIPTLLAGHAPSPSLLHGDLWSGNAARLASGEPVIFDPAVYYGDREADLAMTELFGGFGADFYAAYREAWPLPDGLRASPHALQPLPRAQPPEPLRRRLWRAGRRDDVTATRFGTMTHDRRRRCSPKPGPSCTRGIAYALVASALFGASTPLARALVGAVDPLWMAGILYAGSGIGLSLALALRHWGARGLAPPRRADCAARPRLARRGRDGGRRRRAAAVHVRAARHDRRDGEPAPQSGDGVHGIDRLVRLRRASQRARRRRDGADRRRLRPPRQRRRLRRTRPWRAPDRRGVSLLGGRQQPDPHRRGQRRDARRRGQGRRGRRGQRRARSRAGRERTAAARRIGDGGGGAPRLRREPRALHLRAAGTGRGARERVFLHRPLHRRRRRLRRARRTARARLLDRAAR